MLGLDDVTPYDEPVEDQPTFEGNALLKARAGLAATGLPVGRRRLRAVRRRPQRDAGGAVGPLVRSAQVATTATTRCCSTSSHDVPDERRGAHFTCAVAFCAPGGRELVVVEGRMDGRVIRETRGSGGFGYDVVFEADEIPGRTTAELDPADKDAISHRGRALREIAPQIAALLA